MGPAQARKKFNFKEHWSELAEPEFHRIFRMTSANFLKLLYLISSYCERTKKKDADKNRDVSVEVMLKKKFITLGGDRI